MKVGSCQFDIPEARNFEHVHVAWIASYVETAQVSFGDVAAIGEVGRHHPQLLIHVSANIYSLMATRAPERLEKLVTLLLLAGEGAGFMTQISVEPRVGRG